jgi:hypothetical protein
MRIRRFVHWVIVLAVLLGIAAAAFADTAISTSLLRSRTPSAAALPCR